jgi:uncharacterized short protein YbdD (DUF466 family)
MVLDDPELEASLASQARAAQHVVFYQESVFLAGRSKLEGRRIFEDRDYVRITQPGGRSTFVAEVKPDPDTNEPSKFILQYPKQWAQYKAKQEQTGDGLPLAAWDALSPAQIDMLKGEHIHTIDQLALLNDGDLARLGMGFDEFRKRARTYLEHMRSAEPMNKVMAELQAERDRHEASEQLMRDEILALRNLINSKREDSEFDDTTRRQKRSSRTLGTEEGQNP